MASWLRRGGQVRGGTDRERWERFPHDLNGNVHTITHSFECCADCMWKLMIWIRRTMQGSRNRNIYYKSLQLTSCLYSSPHSCSHFSPPPYSLFSPPLCGSCVNSTFVCRWSRWALIKETKTFSLKAINLNCKSKRFVSILCAFFKAFSHLPLFQWVRMLHVYSGHLFS